MGGRTRAASELLGAGDDVLRAVAGQAPVPRLTYSPGPGIYSRLERAVEAMPETIRVQELPGLIRRYKDGVPGWELKAVDLDSVVAGRDVVPRAEILAAVKERSPVYTHREVVLGGRPQRGLEPVVNQRGGVSLVEAIDRQPYPTLLGRGVSHARPAYESYGQGGQDYSELLLLQPGARGVANDFSSHWPRDELTGDAVAHARYDIHGDALRINELQSDLGIYNRRQREIQPAPSGRDAELIAMKDRRESDAMYIERMRDLGHEVARGDDGGWVVVGSQSGRPLPFPLEDAWADILIKRLALEAARGGHRAIEVASPRAIADKVGGNIDNYEHFYGKVVPGAIERLGRKMGGMVDESASIAPSAGTPESLWTASRQRLRDEIDDYEMAAGLRDLSAEGSYRQLVGQLEGGGAIYPESQRLYRLLMRNEGLMADEAAERMTELMSLAERQARATAEYRVHHHQGRQYGASQAQPPGRRYLMSDEMRRRILTQGIGASLLAPMAMRDE